MNKQIYSTIIICVVLWLMSSILHSCNNEQVFEKATVKTCQVNSASVYTANCGGLISADGGSNVTARGVCWSTSPNPTIENDTTVDGSGIGFFTSQIQGLTPGTTYFVRAYAVNKGGVGYSFQISFTSCLTLTDICGNVYTSVKIGTQIWMVENLKTTKYNDGTSIPNDTVSTSWKALSTPSCCYYNNDADFARAYGALYNWYTVNTGKLAPSGWHVPTNTEWNTLENNLGGNNYNFLGLLGGYRDGSGKFVGIGINGVWWTSTEYSTSNAWHHYIFNNDSGVYRDFGFEQSGFSVRCVRDN